MIWPQVDSLKRVFPPGTNIRLQWPPVIGSHAPALYADTHGNSRLQRTNAWLLLFTCKRQQCNMPHLVERRRGPDKSKQHILCKMFEAFLVCLYGLFEILRCVKQSQLTHFEKQLVMRKRRKKRMTAAFISALFATRPEMTFYTIPLYNVYSLLVHY